MKKEMLINVLQPEETRIAILEDGILEELYVERVSNESFVGNIYKGRIVNIEPSIQAAFVDFGVGRNGFLHISDVDPIYYADYNDLGELYDPQEKPKDRPTRRGDRSERDRPERGRSDRGRPERERPERDRSEKDRPERDRSERDRLERDRPERDRAERERPEKDRPERDRSEKERPERERPEKVRAKEERVEAKEPEGPRRKPRREEDDSRRKRDRDRGRGRGRKRQDEDFLDDDLPPEVSVSSESLPDLDDFQLSEEDNKFGAGLDVEPEKKVDRQPAAKPPRSPEPIAIPAARKPVEEKIERKPEPKIEEEPKPKVEKIEKVVEADDDDGFGAGLFDSEEGLPGIEDQQGYYRETDASDEEDEDGFGSGLFDEEFDSDPEPQVSRSESSEDDEEKPKRRRRRRRGRRRKDSDEESPITSERTEKSTTAVREPRTEDFDDEGDADDEEEDSILDSRLLDDQEEIDEVEEVDDVDVDVDDDDDFDEDDRPRRSRKENGRRGGPRGRNGARMSSRRPRQRPPIQEVFKRGQEVLVQVIKEGIGNKGPTLSTYVSIPGRYLVLMPGLKRVGVSRKIIDDDARKQLRDTVLELDRPDNVGFIIRTAGLDRSPKELERDLSYLVRLWEVVVRRIREQRTPAVIYQESDMIIRTIRDIFTSDIDTIFIDEPEAYERAKEFMQVVSPKYVDRLKLYNKPIPLFHNQNLEQEIDRIQRRAVPLPKGGSIVIDQTEALVAIDVNSGNFRADDNAEETAYQINLAAAKEIARQLRLRDLGGVIVNDFIDMREERHRRGVENALRDAVQRDRARTKILRMSAFGLIEMTRQRIRPSLKRSFYRECPTCEGTGLSKTVESMCIECMRLLTFISQRKDIARIDLVVDDELSGFLQNNKRKELTEIEGKSEVTINIIAKDMRSPEDFELTCYNDSNEPLKVDFGNNRGRR